MSKTFCALVCLLAVSWAVTAAMGWYFLATGNVGVLASAIFCVGFSVFSTYELRQIHGYERRER